MESKILKKQYIKLQVWLFSEAKPDPLVFIRVIVGLWMIWYGKDIFIDDWFEERSKTWGEEGLGFSNPILMLYLSKISEIVFGCLFAVGLFTRLSSFILLVIMSVAVVIAQGWKIFPYDRGEITFFYWLFFAAFVFIGGGKYSLDHSLFNRKKYN
ncbi:DoxX family protein [Sphingobacterium sp. lm-10]|uniref:DoxX family protein n=1 Tax=Sphingobacterium sp. lm-10 TaxID=2944904 RepID=UPI002020FDA9|nr:DoxX family protein [Sphingobacterium sp. lm-10]MCL7988742.1 DoxX family protein [Sphingobacterium sp. lm-10]